MIAAAVVIGALILVPGIGASLAVVPPGGLSIEGRFALAFGLGYGLAAGVATLLALAHVFTRPAFVIAVVLVTLAVWVLALWRVPWREHVASIVTQAREAPVTLGAGLVLLAAVAIARAFFPAEQTLAIRSGWRYWSDGLEVAAAGHVPAETHQWGIVFPSTVSKVVLNCFEGGTSFLLGPDPLVPMQGILTVTAVGLVAGLLAVGREFGLRIFAPLVPALVLLVPHGFTLPGDLAGDLRYYTAEDIGRLAAFAALVLGIYAFRTSAPRVPVIVTGLLLACAGLSHLLPTLLAGVMLGSFAFASALVQRRSVRSVLLRGLALTGIFLVSYVAVIGLSGGDLGWQGAEGATFQSLPPKVDPTRSFARGKYVNKRPKQHHFLLPPKELVSQFGTTVSNRTGRGWEGLLLLFALSVLALVLVVFVRSLIPVAVVAWGLMATILGVALLFSFRYSTVVPGDFGPRRMYGYVAIAIALLVAVILEAGAQLLAAPRRLTAVVLPLAATGVAVILTFFNVPSDRDLARGDAGLQVIDQVAATVPCGTRMLANTRTAGSWEATTGRLAVTEGHAPYLRPEVMTRVLPVLLGANKFFGNPEKNRDYLTRQHVQYLVVVKPEVWVGNHGPRVPREGDAAAISRLEGVHRLLRGRWVSIFAVGAASASTAGEQPDRCPL